MNDIKFALRMLRKNPGFTLVAVFTLALGIGSTTTVFSVVNGVLLKPLEFPGADRIVYVFESNAEQGQNRRHTSPENFLDWREKSTAFEALSFSAEYSGMKTRSFQHTGTGEEDSRQFDGRFVPTNYFAVFGVQAMMGRDFSAADEAPGAPRTLVVSHDFWMEMFGGDPGVIGQNIILENQGRFSYEVIGVLPEFPSVPGGDVFVSCVHMGRPMTRRGGTMLRVVGRLKPDASVERAEAELSALQRQIHEEYRHLESHGPHMAMGNSVSIMPILDIKVGSVRQSLYVFSGAVLLVLLIACANVANLLLARALSRQREVAIRAALGASRGRVIRQLLCESLMLSVLGGVLGALFAWWGLKMLVHFNAGSIPRIAEVSLDMRVLAFTFAISVGTGLLFGLIPALQTSKADLGTALKEGAGRLTGGQAHHRLSNAFTVAQVALALVLLIGAGLLMQSFSRLQNVDLGFKRIDELLTANLILTGASYANESQRRAFIRDLVERARATPGVEDACFVSMIPDRGNGWPSQFARLDRPQVEFSRRPSVNMRVVTPKFADTYGIPLLRGRDFSESDVKGAGEVAVINQAFADEYFPNENPVGKMVDCVGPRQIVGVIGNVKNVGRQRETRAEIFLNYGQWENPSGFLTVRAKNSLALAPIVTSHVKDLNPRQTVKSFRTMGDYLDSGIARPRFRTMLLGVFAVVALILASVGIYGVMAYSVAQRTGEVGIRMALGAQRSDVMSMILRQGVRLTLVGVFLGLLGSMALTRILESYLFNITATDLKTFFGIATLLSVIGLIACVIPAIRAMRVSPIRALRYE